MKPLMFARLGAACLVVASAWLPRFVSASHHVVLDPQKPDPKAAPADPGFHFTDVTAASGIRFRHNNGAFGKKYLPETLGSGVAFLDFDQENRPATFDQAERAEQHIQFMALDVDLDE